MAVELASPLRSEQPQRTPNPEGRQVGWRGGGGGLRPRNLKVDLVFGAKATRCPSEICLLNLSMRGRFWL